MRRALSLDPTYRGAHNDLGVTLIRQGRRAEAFAAYQRAAALDPSDQTAAKNIRAMARHNKFPLPKWARRPILWGPGVVVALVLKVRNRHEMDSLPKTARREVSRWTRREVAGVASSPRRSPHRSCGRYVAIGLVTARFASISDVARASSPPNSAPLPSTTQAVCAVSQLAALIDASGTGFTPGANHRLFAELEHRRRARFRCSPAPGARIHGSGRDQLRRGDPDHRLTSHPGMDVAGDQVQLQTDSAALRIDAGCSPVVRPSCPRERKPSDRIGAGSSPRPRPPRRRWRTACRSPRRPVRSW